MTAETDLLPLPSGSAAHLTAMGVARPWRVFWSSGKGGHV